MSQQVFVPFLLTLFAGISTGIGSAIAFFAKRTNTSFLSLSLGFSAGVMIYVSFVELFTSSVQTLVEMHGKSEGTFYATLSFFGGIVLILLIDKLIPRYENPHEMHRVEEMSEKAKIQLDVKPKLLRVGMVTALVLAIHNFPEGMVTFLAALKDVNIAIPIPSPLPYTTYRRVFRYPFLFFTLQATARKPFGSRFCLDWQSRWEPS